MDAHDYIQAAKGGAIIDRQAGDRRELVRIAVTRAFSLKGQPLPSDEDFNFMVDAIEQKISTAYPYMTGQELTYITEMGVAGELTKETRPTASAIFGWMAAYMNSEERKEAMRTYRRTLQWNDRRDTELTREEKDELNRQAEVRALRTLWDEFKTHGRILETEHFRGYVAMAMDGFTKRNIMQLTPANWDAARKQADHNRRRFQLASTGLRAVAPDVPDSIVKWTMLEMCFQGLANANYELTINA